MLDVIDCGGQCPLKLRANATGHLFRWQPRVLPGYCDDGYFDFRENVCGRSQRRKRPQNEQEQRHHHEGVGPV